VEIINKKIEDLIPYHNNPRLNDEAVEYVKNSIKEFGFKVPMVIDKNNVIVAGHTRYKASKELGLKEVPCIIADDLTDEQIKAFRLADNKVSEKAEWDFELLDKELDDIDIDMTEFGFDLDLDDEEEQEIVEDEVPDVPEEPKAKLGDIYQLGNHRLMCGDSTSEEDVNKLINGDTIELLMTDPPYGINADKMTMGTGKKDFHRGNWDSFKPPIKKMLKYADKQCIWGGNYFTDVLPITNDWLCWWKKNDNLSFSEFELAWTNYGINCRHISHHWGNEKKLHVTMKPVVVMAFAIEKSQTNGNVLDLFGGSGSTLIACEQLNRKCYMMELDPHYIDVIIQRWENFTGEKAVKISG